MELYFKDLEDEAGTAAADIQCACEWVGEGVNASPEPAEEDAFAELSERVSAARLVY